MMRTVTAMALTLAMAVASTALGQIVPEQLNQSGPFVLGMTLEEAKAAWPGLEVRTETHPEYRHRMHGPVVWAASEYLAATLIAPPESKTRAYHLRFTSTPERRLYSIGSELQFDSPRERSAIQDWIATSFDGERQRDAWGTFLLAYHHCVTGCRIEHDFMNQSYEWFREPDARQVYIHAPLIMLDPEDTGHPAIFKGHDIPATSERGELLMAKVIVFIVDGPMWASVEQRPPPELPPPSMPELDL
jgi:hypothetical protein